MSGWSRFFLVLLRLVIGWHLLFAGVEKFRKDSWSSEGYLRDAYGPLAPAFRAVAGDPLLDLITPNQPGELPPPVVADWEAYFARFARHYELDAKTRDKAEAALEKQKQETARWLTSGTKLVKRTPPHGPAYEVERTTPQRLEDYRNKINAARDLHDRGLAEARKSGLVEQVQKVFRDIDQARADANRMRRELKVDLDQQTAAMKEELAKTLPPAKLEEKPAPPEPPRNRWKEFGRWREWSLLDWNDAVVACGLAGVGGLLLVGLFTRLACVVGALFLIGFYVAAPALLGVPEALRAEGYPFVNKNIVEAMALLALATLPTGRWAGLDAILFYLNPFNWRRQV